MLSCQLQRRDGLPFADHWGAALSLPDCTDAGTGNSDPKPNTDVAP